MTRKQTPIRDSDTAASKGQRRRDGRTWQGIQKPRGVMLAAVLVCLLVILLFTGALVRALGLRQRTLRIDEQQLQCLFLLESAVDRAKAQCTAESSYSGETWTTSVVDRDVPRQATALIRVLPVANEPMQRRVQIEARWPDDPFLRVQQTKELIVTLPISGAAS